MGWTAIANTVAKALGAGANGSVWHVGQNGKIYYWAGSGWLPGPDSGCVATKVSADSQQNPWHIGNTGGVYRWRSGGWSEIGAADAIDLACGRTSIWHVGRNGRLYRWDGGNGWIEDPAASSVTQVAIASDGTVWHIGARDMIYRQQGSVWQQLQGPAGCIATAPDGSVFHTGDGSNDLFNPWKSIYRLEPSGWAPYANTDLCASSQLIADGSGRLWGRSGIDVAVL
jgi:Tectonin domain